TIPIYAGRLVDAVAEPDRAAGRTAGIVAILIMAALGAVQIAGRHLSFLGIIQVTTRMMREAAQEAFWRVQRFATDWHANSFAGSIVRRISRGMWAIDVLNDTVVLALIPAVLVLFGSAMMLGLRWPAMGLLVLAGAIVYLALSAGMTLGYVAPSARLSNRWDTRIGGALADAVGCNAVVKGFAAEAREDGVLAGILGKWQSRTRRTWVRGTYSNTAQMAALLVLRTTVVGTALMFWWQGRATPGDVTYVLTAYFVVHGYLRDLGHHIANLQRCVNDMEEMVALHAEPLGIADRQPGRDLSITAGRVSFESVTFHYAGHATALYDRLTLTIRAGERVGLVGHSGSGKSTFVKLIQRLYDVTGGRIAIDGQDIALVTQASLRRQIAVVAQEPVLFHRTLAENIAYARPGASPAEIERAARLANAHDFIVRLPRGYATLVGERGVKLSGGERQRVALARAFLADTPILILDEATSSLDSHSETLIQDAMERLMRGRTCIVIAHRLSTVRALDRILVFDRGSVVEEGSHTDLMQRTGPYRDLFTHQAAGLLEV
ncbi:MAG: ATP-binding cassette, subfamily bacterial, partial [Acetobacteraceae bacterium]|nr:ATP-binding cassette, subfamily bacterial [Acetobacteraceae bacterium]